MLSVDVRDFIVVHGDAQHQCRVEELVFVQIVCIFEREKEKGPPNNASVIYSTVFARDFLFCFQFYQNI